MAMVPAPQFTYWQCLSLPLAAPVVVWGAWPFHRAAWENLRHGTSTMDTLSSLGTIAALGWSIYERCAGAELRALLHLGAKDVTVLRDGPHEPVEEWVPTDRLTVGMRFVVRPGEKIATDGVVKKG